MTGPLMKSFENRDVSLVPGSWVARYWYMKESCAASLPNNIPSRKYWLPMLETMLSHVGSWTLTGGRVGLKLTWQNAQVMPTVYGGSTLAGSSRYLASDHFWGSKFLLANSCSPMTPLE